MASEAESFLERGEEVGERRRQRFQAEEALKEVWVQRARQQEELEARQARLETMRAESIHSCGLHPHPLSGVVVKSPAERLQ